MLRKLAFVVVAVCVLVLGLAIHILGGSRGNCGREQAVLGAGDLFGIEDSAVCSGAGARSDPGSTRGAMPQNGAVALKDCLARDGLFEKLKDALELLGLHGDEPCVRMALPVADRMVLRFGKGGSLVIDNVAGQIQRFEREDIGSSVHGGSSTSPAQAVDIVQHLVKTLGLPYDMGEATVDENVEMNDPDRERRCGIYLEPEIGGIKAGLLSAEVSTESGRIIGYTYIARTIPEDFAQKISEAQAQDIAAKYLEEHGLRGLPMSALGRYFTSPGYSAMRVWWIFRVGNQTEYDPSNFGIYVDAETGLVLTWGR